MSTPGQLSLRNFYESVRFQNPDLAERIRADVEDVAIYALGADKSGGQEAATRLRHAALEMPVLHQKVLENALEDLGYSLA